MFLFELIFMFCSIVFLIILIAGVYYFLTARGLLKAKLKEYQSLSEKMFNQKITPKRYKPKSTSAVQNTSSVNVEDAEFRDAD